MAMADALKFPGNSLKKHSWREESLGRMKSTSLYFKFPGNKNGTGVCPSFRRRNWCGTLSLLLDPNESRFYVLQEIIDSSHSHLVKVKNKKIFLSFFYPCHSISPVALYSVKPPLPRSMDNKWQSGRVGGWAVWLLYGRWVGRRRVFLSRIMSRSHSADWVGILFFFLLLLFDRCFI
jgi:hypothetical protein